jgi:hypothetical protein
MKMHTAEPSPTAKLKKYESPGTDTIPEEGRHYILRSTSIISTGIGKNYLRNERGNSCTDLQDG